MKVGILTYYFVHNYGAILQAYGMQKVLESLGHEVSFLTFDRNYDHMPEGADRKYNLSIKSVPLLTRYFISNGVGTFYYNFIKREQLRLFTKQQMHIAERYSDANQAAVLIGSDEVFSIDVGINPFLYGHGIPVKNIFSYAASFGSTQQEDIDGYGCRELIKSGLEKFSKVGVRDIASAQIVKAVSSRDAILTCDPVILYGFKKEIQQAFANKSSEKYLLLYSYDKNFNEPDEIRTLRDFARKNNLKIFSVGYYHKWCDKNIMCSPVEMLEWFCNCEMVITDTFHGSVISIITNTPLMVNLTKENQKVEYLLEEYHLTDRLTADIHDVDILFDQKTDYNAVNVLLEQKRQASMDFLKHCLGE